MQQFQKPLILNGHQKLDHTDNFMLHDVDTASSLPAMPPLYHQGSSPPPMQGGGYLPLDDPPPLNIPKIIAVIVISFFALYTFAIICVELFKIFAQIITEK
jgi:hypothetical protein